MIIYLRETEQRFVINSFVVSKFDGENLRTYLHDRLVDTQPANSGECFYIQPKGLKKKPIITKAKLPEKRGEKISWALSFIGKNKLASSYDEFLKEFYALQDTEGEENFVCELDKKFNYAIAFKKPEETNGLMKPALAFISDEISSDDMKNLLDDYKKTRKLYCPEDFFDYL